MNSKLLSRIVDRRIASFAFVIHSQAGLRSVILHLQTGGSFEFRSREFRFGPYEAYTLEVRECDSKKGTNEIFAGWTVGTIDVAERQDWLEPGDPTIETIGRNPVDHSWGAIGSAPTSATHTVVVQSSIALISDTGEHQAMVYLTDYPGLVSFTTDAQEIAAVHRAHGGQA